jgi:hypothetical protein
MAIIRSKQASRYALSISTPQSLIGGTTWTYHTSLTPFWTMG